MRREGRDGEREENEKGVTFKTFTGLGGALPFLAGVNLLVLITQFSFVKLDRFSSPNEEGLRNTF